VTREPAAPAELTDAARPALLSLLGACADTKLILGYHYLEWTFGAPALEAGIAACAMGQDELGHARVLHGVLQQAFALEPEHLVEHRPAAQFASASFLDKPLPNWPAVVAANAFVDLAASLVLESFRGSTFGPIARIVDKMLEEERHHHEHGRGWFGLLIRRGGAARQEMVAAARDALVSVQEFIGPPAEDAEAALLESGIRRLGTAEVRMRLGEQLSDLAEFAGLDEDEVLPGGSLCVDPRAIAWTEWGPARRRVGTSGPDEELLKHLRGTKNVQYRKA